MSQLLLFLFGCMVAGAASIGLLLAARSAVQPPAGSSAKTGSD